MFSRNKDNGHGADKTAEEKAMEAPPLKPFSKKGAHSPVKLPSKNPSSSSQHTKRTIEIPGAAPQRMERPRPGGSDSKLLTVGRDIRLSGEITECEHLIVEGHVEVILNDARLIDVAPTGVFKGNADVIEADISGYFEGNLTAHSKLTVRAGGKISGTIRYGSIVIEAGGEVSGDMRALDQHEDAAPSGGTE